MVIHLAFAGSANKAVRRTGVHQTRGWGIIPRWQVFVRGNHCYPSYQGLWILVLGIHTKSFTKVLACMYTLWA